MKITRLLQLYTGPEVRIRIGSSSHEYRLPKALLCKQSPYFAAMFQGDFKEGAEQSSKLEEVDGVVSPQSFEMLVQWMVLGRIVFKNPPATDAITSYIELARLADMCDVTGLESIVAEQIKVVIVADAALHHPLFSRDHNANAYSITKQHVESAVLLPDDHPVRGVLAMALVEGFVMVDDYPFRKEIREIPTFAVDFLAAVKATTKTITRGDYSPEFMEPLTGSKLRLT